MTKEDYEERMKDSKYKDLAVTNCEDGEYYVFISYRGNSWKVVLTEIVAKLQDEYGLRVYFDKDFASKTNNWIEQFRKNMDSRYCKAFLCFFDEGYVSSYATLMELMHAMNKRSRLNKSIISINFDIDWDKLEDCDADTGLGTEDFNNPLSEKEKEIFEIEFDLLSKKAEYADIVEYYQKGEELRVCDCARVMSILQPKNQRRYVDDSSFYEQFILDFLKKNCPGVFDPNLVKNAKNPTADQEISAPKKEDNMKVLTVNPEVSDVEEGYRYTVFGKEYTAGKGEQAKLMYDAFEALVTRYPECADTLTKKTSISRKEDVKNPGTKDAYPVYFRACKEFDVNGQKYLVGTSYSFDCKLKEIKGMFQICGVDCNEFVLYKKGSQTDTVKADLSIGKMQESENTSAERQAPVPDNILKSADGEGYVYRIFGKEYTAGKGEQGKLMYDAFEALVTRHLECAGELTKRTSIAKKEDVKKPGTKDAYPVYFRACKEFDVAGQKYVVGTSYGFDDKLKEIKGMFNICREDVEQFEILSAQKKKARTMKVGKDGYSVEKQGLGELL